LFPTLSSKVHKNTKKPHRKKYNFAEIIKNNKIKEIQKKAHKIIGKLRDFFAIKNSRTPFQNPE